MLSAGICFIIGAVLTTSAFQLPQLVIGRIVLGFGVGEVSRSLAPCHEITPGQTSLLSSAAPPLLKVWLLMLW